MLVLGCGAKPDIRVLEACWKTSLVAVRTFREQLPDEIGSGVDRCVVLQLQLMDSPDFHRDPTRSLLSKNQWFTAQLPQTIRYLQL